MPELENITDKIVLLRVARDELDTIIQYTEMLDRCPNKADIEPALNEIRGDEFNHALIALLMAAKVMGISIATDDITPDPNNIEVKS